MAKTEGPLPQISPRNADQDTYDAYGTLYH